MIISASELREKDVINTCGGRRLGFICDYQIDTECGKITAIFVTEQLFGMFGGRNAVKIPWEKVVCIGADTVLVEMPENFCCEPCGCRDGEEEKRCREHGKRKRGGWLF